MKAYLELVQKLTKSFQSIKFEQIPKGKNSRADSLASYGFVVKDQSNRYVLHTYIEKSTISKDMKEKITPLDDNPIG